jgi:hypothetical protein
MWGANPASGKINSLGIGGIKFSRRAATNMAGYPKFAIQLVMVSIIFPNIPFSSEFDVIMGEETSSKVPMKGI